VSSNDAAQTGLAPIGPVCPLGVNKSFYTLDMFEFIHHLEHGCYNLQGLI
jgi:hypothetical protein